MKIEHGMVHVYTGNGKGKTTVALGLALRAIGWGLRVMMVQFVKGYKEIGEIKYAELSGGRFDIKQFALDTKRGIRELEVRSRRQEAERAVAFAEEAIKSGDYDLVILDELSVALHYELLDMGRVLRLIREKPSSVELVITGRNAPKELIEAADYVTEMRMIRHPYRKNIQARPGVDY
ncbi:MAG: cob(I)yrinic acid a,c-diamide adenosyltransferase [Armatimonadota bacterium]